MGFIHHQELLGGLQGKDALTAYVAVALLEAGERSASGQAIGYLEDRLDAMDDSYTVALTAYALGLGKSPRLSQAIRTLMDLAQEDENGLYWGDSFEPVMDQQRMMPYPVQQSSAAIEATGYATMALLLDGDSLNAAKAAQWITAQRNSLGGFGSTQDTVVGIQALVAQQTGARADVDLTVSVVGQDFRKDVDINAGNFDVLQVVQLPEDVTIRAASAGRGQSGGAGGASLQHAHGGAASAGYTGHRG